MNLKRQIERILRESQKIAVLGAHRDKSRHAYRVPQYFHEQGYHIFPINPRQLGEVLWGEPVRARLDELKIPIDVVDIFRQAAALPAHLSEILAMKPLPKVVWMQLGVRNEEVARALEERGIEVIQDRCMLAEHREQK